MKKRRVWLSVWSYDRPDVPSGLGRAETLERRSFDLLSRVSACRALSEPGNWRFSYACDEPSDAPDSAFGIPLDARRMPRADRRYLSLMLDFVPDVRSLAEAAEIAAIPFGGGAVPGEFRSACMDGTEMWGDSVPLSPEAFRAKLCLSREFVEALLRNPPARMPKAAFRDFYQSGETGDPEWTKSLEGRTRTI